MSIEERWLLPEGIEEVLPPHTRQLEHLRRALLDLYESWGYELVMPPFIEFLESLLTGTGNDLDLQTFKLTDQLSGRTMGVRADMSPQVARIDAHVLQRHAPRRLCYMGTVLRTRSDGFGGSRSPLQVGAELYGHYGLESDLEVLSLMLETLSVANINEVYLDLGHVTIFRSLVQQAALDKEQESLLFEALQRKAIPEIQTLLAEGKLADSIVEMFLALAELHGGDEVLSAAEIQLGMASDEVHCALEALKRLAAGIRQRAPNLPIHFDLAELHGYNYHTGIVFAAYIPGQGREIARGGRYDHIGKVFGRARPATGFSTDLKTLLSLSPSQATTRGAIYAPCDDDPILETLVIDLRSNKERVIRALPGMEEHPKEMGCDRILIFSDGNWQIRPL